MKNALMVLAFAAILMAGCFGSTPPAPQAQNGTAVPPAANNTTAQPPAAPVANATAPAPSNGTAAPPPATGGTTTSQVNCATLTPDCNSCIAKAGCGWCKSTSACYSGDASGPSGTIQCQPADWSVSAAGCQAPTSPQGTSCGQQVGCGNCLSGSGCKFCRQGAICADASSTEDCFGGWITNYYVCAAGSQ